MTTQFTSNNNVRKGKVETSTRRLSQNEVKPASYWQGAVFTAIMIAIAYVLLFHVLPNLH